MNPKDLLPSQSSNMPLDQEINSAQELALLPFIFLPDEMEIVVVAVFFLKKRTGVQVLFYPPSTGPWIEQTMSLVPIPPPPSLGEIKINFNLTKILLMK